MSDIINRSECIEVVRNYFKNDKFNERQIRNFEVKRVSEGLVGFMGEYYKLHVELDDELTTDVAGSRNLSFFVKSVPVLDEIFRKECLDKGFFEKESQIYDCILRDIQRYASKKLYPECYYTRQDLIVLGDLSAQNLCHITPGDDVCIEFFQVVLRTQAHLHAASIAYELDTGINIGKKFNNILHELQLTMKNVWYVTGIKGIIPLAKMIPKYHGTPTQQFITTKLYDVLCDACRLTDPSDTYRNVLCHRDSWARNIFFKCNAKDIPIDCLIVDFQLTRYCPPAIDVLNLIEMNARKKQKELIENECLEYYYKTFTEIMKEKGLEKEIFSWQEFLKSCHEIELAVLILKAICAPLTEMPEGLGSKMREEEPVRFDHYMNTDREEMFLRVMDMEPTYKEHILTPVEALIDYLVNDFNL